MVTAHQMIPKKGIVLAIDMVAALMDSLWIGLIIKQGHSKIRRDITDGWDLIGIG